MNKPLPKELTEDLGDLGEEDIERIAAYARSLKEKNERKARKVEIMKLAGSISKEEIDQIKAAIEEGCEKIDHEGW